MNWYTLERVWRQNRGRKNLRVRFNDWTQHIRWFEIQGESEDQRRFVGRLDNGERISYPKNSKGWILYYEESEYSAHAV